LRIEYFAMAVHRSGTDYSLCAANNNSSARVGELDYRNVSGYPDSVKVRGVERRVLPAQARAEYAARRDFRGAPVRVKGNQRVDARFQATNAPA
jgi:hypothetical protein